MLKTQILLADTLKDNKENKKLLIQSLGYKNLNKGYRRLAKSLETDYIDEELLYKLSDISGIEKSKIDDCISEAKQQIDEKRKAREKEMEDFERANFKPHLWRLCERRIPFSIFSVVWSGEAVYKKVPIPTEIWTYPIDLQLDAIENVIQKDFEKSKGVAGTFGAITGYLFRKTYDETYKFDSNGKFIEKCKFAFEKEEKNYYSVKE